MDRISSVWDMGLRDRLYGWTSDGTYKELCEFLHPRNGKTENVENIERWMINGILVNELRSGTFPCPENARRMAIHNIMDNQHFTRGNALFLRQCLRAAICAPVRLLPVELLQDIFVLAADDDDPAECLRVRIRIACVSNHWRAVAIAMGKLWAEVIYTEEFPASKHRVAIMESFSRRVGKWQLCLTVHEDFDKKCSQRQRRRWAGRILPLLRSRSRYRS
ncbi:hypothetical protein BD626DRAFT_503256, partial [Schizophyllum amplum]